jgi:RES domain-containing protein
MTIIAWRIATDTKDYVATDLNGQGAEKSGGRWNRPGLPVVYSTTSVSLACLETVVHLNAGGLPLNRFLVSIEIPAAVWARRKVLSANTLAVGWTATPAGKVSLDLGDDWLRQANAALLLVPSIIVPEEFNILINPKHSDSQKLKAKKMRPWVYDPRFLLR